MTSIADPSTEQEAPQALSQRPEPRPGTRAYAVAWLAYARQELLRAEVAAHEAYHCIGKGSLTYHARQDDVDACRDTVRIWEAHVRTFDSREWRHAREVRG